MRLIVGYARSIELHTTKEPTIHKLRSIKKFEEMPNIKKMLTIRSISLWVFRIPLFLKLIQIKGPFSRV